MKNRTSDEVLNLLAKRFPDDQSLYTEIINLKAILNEAGTNMGAVVKTTVFLKNMDDFAEMNAVYKSFFDTDCPARSAVQVAKLPKDVLVEIEAIAVL